MKKIYVLVSFLASVFTMYATGVDTSYVVFTASPVGAVNNKALFTVSNSGTESLKVYFSKGNLRYDMAAKEFSFWESQYGYTGNQEPNKNPSGKTTGYLDVFCWGASGCTVNGTTYLPDRYSTTIPQPKNNTIAGTYFDYGVYNAIVNGGNLVGHWRMLSEDEWTYLLSRTAAIGGSTVPLRTMIQITGVTTGVSSTTANGLLLLPDAWTCPDGITLTYGATSCSSNVLTLAQFTELEKAGAVFLPCTGYRYSSSYSNEGTRAYYWTANCYNNNYVNGVYFTNTSYYGVVKGNSYTSYSCYTSYQNYNGNPVRLVQTARCDK